MRHFLCRICNVVFPSEAEEPACVNCMRLRATVPVQVLDAERAALTQEQEEQLIGKMMEWAVQDLAYKLSRMQLKPRHGRIVSVDFNASPLLPEGSSEWPTRRCIRLEIH